MAVAGRVAHLPLRFGCSRTSARVPPIPEGEGGPPVAALSEFWLPVFGNTQSNQSSFGSWDSTHQSRLTGTGASRMIWAPLGTTLEDDILDWIVAGSRRPTLAVVDREAGYRRDEMSAAPPPTGRPPRVYPRRRRNARWRAGLAGRVLMVLAVVAISSRASAQIEPWDWLTGVGSGEGGALVGRRPSPEPGGACPDVGRHGHLRPRRHLGVDVRGTHLVWAHVRARPRRLRL